MRVLLYLASRLNVGDGDVATEKVSFYTLNEQDASGVNWGKESRWEKRDREKADLSGSEYDPFGQV